MHKHYLSRLAGLTVSILILWVGEACNQTPAASGASSVPNVQEALDNQLISIPYNLKEPNLELELPTSLDEVSALSWANGQLAMVQDEQGILFLYDIEKDTIASKIAFALPGDFEGVEIVGDTAFMLRSDGILFWVNLTEGENPERHMIRTWLGERADTEGLGYDAQSGNLLIACKEPSHYQNGNERWRSVFAFDPATEILDETPVLTIDLFEIKGLLTRTAETEKQKERAIEFAPDKKKSFKPSAIAVHPLTGHYYVLASAGKLLLVIDKQGRIISANHLSRKRFSQPEGICFSPEGDLFISNEARDETALLLRFPYQPNE